jgi:diguanylate cyclase (GGDEF)-like protein
LFYWPVVEGGPNRLIIPRAGEIGRIEVAGEDGPPTALQTACASLGAPSAAWAGGFACVLSHDRVGQGRSASGAGGSHSLPDGTFLAGMAALGAIGFALSLRCLHRRVVAPLGRITTAIQRIPADESLEQEDEFGAIARRLDELCEELQLAREDAQRMQNSIDYTVLRETKEISTQLRRAQRAAELDPLTGLANRRFIDERLEAVFSEQSSRGVNLAIVMLDVDNFKPLNDLAGHAAGDALLRFVGALLRGSLREGDVGVRYGGDEFVLVLVDVCGAQARSIAERLVRLFAQQATAAKLPGHVTLSAGVASLDEIGAASGAELLARADDALYRAKRGGKNIALSAVD